MKNIDYLLQKVRTPKTNLSNYPKDNELFPTIHGSDTSGKTFCGIDTNNSAWCIRKTGFDWNPIKKEEITCKKCLRELK